MKRFRERDPVKVGLIGAAVLIVIGLVTFYYEDLPLVGGSTYTAQFREAAGLKPDDEVRVAGVKVGEVTDVELAGDHVTVSFRAKDVWLGDKTSAAIKIKTLLGQKNLVLDPLGAGELDPDTSIPLNRTVTPYDVNDAFGDLAKTADAIDTEQLGAAFQTLGQTFSELAPEEVRATFNGLAAMSDTISSRDEELARLLNQLSTFSGTVAERTEQFDALINDGGVLLGEIQSRRDAIHQLLVGTQDLSQQLAGLVEDNQAQLGPALAQLDRVTDVLARNQENLDSSLRLAGPFYRLMGNIVSNGPWVDFYTCGLVPAPGGGCIPPKPGGGG